MISKELLDILACPQCKSEKKEIKEDGEEVITPIDLVYDENKQTLTCHQCRLIFSIKDDIPVMLIDEAEKF